MKRDNWRSYFAGIEAFLLSYCFALFFCGMEMHEGSHAIAALIFGLPYSLTSFTHIIVFRNPLTPNWIYTLVGLAGGIGQSLTSLGFLWLVSALEKTLSNESLLKQKIFFGVRLSFLTVAFAGLLNAVWEGFFTQSYIQSVDNVLYWDLINLACGIISFCILYRRSVRTPEDKNIDICKQ